MTDATLKEVLEPLLTIIVPTYNRADNLSVLLHALRIECVPLSGTVSVLVSDNASTDHTPAVTQELQAMWAELRVYRHMHNCGAEENFCTAIDRVETRYFWIMGDDDCPKRGVIAKLVALLRASSPALVYVQSEWINPLVSADQGEPIGELQIQVLDPVEFARKVHIWFTFISGNIIDRTVMQRALGNHTIRRFTNTSLVQLGWILPVLKSGGRFVFVTDRCVLATKDNSSGYARLTVFGINFSRITREVIGSSNRLSDVVIRRAISNHLPLVIWWARRTPHGTYIAEDPWPGMRRELGGRLIFWLLLVPLGRFPLWLAAPIYLLWTSWRWARAKANKIRTYALSMRHSHGA